MRVIRTLIPLLLLALLAGRTDAAELSDLHLRKMKAVFTPPTKKGRLRAKVRVVGRLVSHRLPRDFMFHPERTPLSLSVGGVTVLSGSGSGEWKQTGSSSWMYRERGERRVKLTIEFGRGEFVFRGRRLDLDGMNGPLDCDVFLFLGEQVFGTRVDGQEKGARWVWIPAGGGIPSKAPGAVPAPPGPGVDVSPGPLSHRVLISGTETFDPTVNTPWIDRLVVRDAGTLAREWTRMFGATPAPTVDFTTEQVLLFYDIGDYYQVFEVTRDATGAVITYHAASRTGPRRCLYRAIAIPRVPGGVTFSEF